MAEEVQGRAKGGIARAKSLTKVELSESARKAALARWGLPRATHEGDLNIPGIAPLKVANLADGRRILTSRAFLEALGRPWKGTYQHTERPNFIDAKNLDPFITEEVEKCLQPVEYISGRGQKIVGYAAELLPLVCDVYLRANDSGAISNKRQREVAELSDVIIRGLAKVGIYALIDDATGYTRERARDELQQILSAYISPELLPWSKRFPDAFYEQLHRVRGWPYRPGNNARNGYIGKLTRLLIYDPLPRGVREELERRNPYLPERKGRKDLHHRLLTKDVGEPHLDKQITSITTLLRISDNWDEFLKHFGRAFPPSEGLFALPAPAKELAD